MRQRPPPYLQQQNNDNYEDMLLPSVYSTEMSVVEASK